MRHVSSILTITSYECPHPKQQGITYIQTHIQTGCDLVGRAIYNSVPLTESNMYCNTLTGNIASPAPEGRNTLHLLLVGS
jgi:hypothetical protein